MLVKGKIFVVTGAGGGIGRALSLNLLDKGAKVAAVDINQNALAETYKAAGELKDKLSTHVCDITDKDAVNKLPQEVKNFHGNVDGLINNAGIIHPFKKVHKLEHATIVNVMNVNFYGTLHMIQAFLPLFEKRPKAHIINISSMGGFMPIPGQTIYGASKAAVKLLTEGLYAELKETHIKITVVFPGAIGTEISKNSGVEIKPPSTKETPKYKSLSPEGAAEIIITGIEKNKYRIRVGSDAKMLDRINRLMPEKGTNIVAKRMADLLED